MSACQTEVRPVMNVPSFGRLRRDARRGHFRRDRARVGQFLATHSPMRGCLPVVGCPATGKQLGEETISGVPWPTQGRCAHWCATPLSRPVPCPGQHRRLRPVQRGPVRPHCHRDRAVSWYCQGFQALLRAPVAQVAEMCLPRVVLVRHASQVSNAFEAIKLAL
jgi:hypothetical protein